MTRLLPKARRSIDPAEARARLWDHRDQMNRDFNELANFFVVAETLLIGATANLIDKANFKALLIGLIGMGSVLTIVWWLVHAKQHRILVELKKRCEQQLPDYKETHAARENAKVFLKYSNTRMLAHILPTLFLSTWALLLCTALAV